ncbi:Glycosyl transferase, family 2 [Fulvimarina pelagi HTCC2506]|uniref:Glycosyl transferase, family 2 n=1 Tax=Fulvimarina pelagi HTCC2506 TaxID=314231 RepID=Q0G6A6_9HYPH|nr:glycosyltransferase family 2 protein [Fulvimarina pelagi]EAU42808.1 Glycosyl transferase, family 2 [Fulvimarina pelagi HTCC2506]
MVGASVVYSVDVVESLAATGRKIISPGSSERPRRGPDGLVDLQKISGSPAVAESFEPLSEPVVKALISRLGLSDDEAREAWAVARRNGTDIARELIFNGRISERDYAHCVAEQLGLGFELPQKNDEVVAATGHATPPFTGALWTCDSRLETKIFLRPKIEQLSAIVRALQERPLLARNCRVATLSAIRDIEAAKSDDDRFAKATLSLSAASPEKSARAVLTGWQGFAMGAMAFVLVWWVMSSFWQVAMTFHLLSAFCFILWICLRSVAAFGRQDGTIASELKSGPNKGGGTRPAPIYSVVVALHKETEVVARLVSALDNLKWPKSCLEVFLVCEADDHATVALCRKHTEGKLQYRVILVPPGNPRTKPKALNHVLPIVAGDFLVLYDAEDEPHPGQLEEAYDRYRASDARLACLQAPLVIRNGDRNWLTSIFAMEYAGLFRAFLPWLARHRLPIPLGGTSNHFKVAVLREVGGWDSHNVTEDADLGMRLKRAGYDIETISSPTLEDAPETVSVWVPQRTRWLKGWVQTYAVHMRHPMLLMRELGVKRFVVFQLLFHGMITAALLLPLAFGLIGFTIWLQWSTGWERTSATALLVLDLAIFVGGYLSFLALTLRGMGTSELRPCVKWLPFVPIYWLCVSVAAYRGLFQLFKNPHAWEKTAHGLASRADKLDPRHRMEPIFDIAVPGELRSGQR